jgi:hypothetical protein
MVHEVICMTVCPILPVLPCLRTYIAYSLLFIIFLYSNILIIPSLRFPEILQKLLIQHYLYDLSCICLKLIKRTSHGFENIQRFWIILHTK